MIKPTTAHMVTCGEYDDYRVLAILTGGPGEAQSFADHYNLTYLPRCRGDQARVEDVDLYGPGWRRPPAEILDGEVVDAPVDAPLEIGR